MDENVFSSKKNTTFGKYKIIEMIGQGGMGRVYKAWDDCMKRIVALKILQQGSSAKTLERFKREAKILASLNHPNIIQIYEAGELSGIAYFTMQYLEAIPIDKYVQQQKMSCLQIAKLMEQLCRIVYVAHNQNIVHRDLKPDNILVDHNGTIYVMDFGIAKTYSEDYGLTKSNEVIGTLAYMSPEQVDGENHKLNYKSDIYSLGIILHVLFSGEIPYSKKDNYVNLALEISTHNWEISAAIPKNVKIICQKATAKCPDARYQNVREMAQDFKNCVLNRKIKPFKNPISHRQVLHVSIFFVVALTFLTVYLSRTSKEKNDYFSQETTKVDEIFTYVSTHEHEKAIALFETEKKSIRLSNEVYSIIGEAYYFIGDFASATTFFNNVINAQDAPETAMAKSLYYQGLILYRKNLYPEAILLLQRSIPFFEQGEELHWVMRFLGICLFRVGKYQEAFDVLEPLVHVFDHDLEYMRFFTKSLQELAILNDNSEKRKKALLYAKKCIELNSLQAENHILLGRVYVDLEEYRLAAFAFRKATEIDPVNIEALELISQIPYFEPTMQEFCFHTLISSINDFVSLPKPELFTQEFEKIEKQHYENYIYWSNSQKHQEKNITSFLEHLNNKTDDKILNRIEKALYSLRYSKSFMSDIDKFSHQNQDPKIKSFLQSIIDKTKKITEKETESAYLYQLAYMYNRNIWNYNISEEILLDFLCSTKHPAFVRYFAANAILHLYGFDSLLGFITQNNNDDNDIITNIIITAVLRANHMYADIDIFFDIFKNNQDITSADIEFLQCLAAGNFYIFQRLYHSQDESLLTFKNDNSFSQEKMISFFKYNIFVKNKSHRLKTIAACNLFSLFRLNDNSEIYQEVVNMIIEGMKSPDNYIRRYSHYYFWNSINFKRGEINYFHLHKMGLADDDSGVVKIILSYTELFNEHFKKQDNVLLDMIIAQSKDIRLYSIMNLCAFSPLSETIDKILYHEDITSFERILTYLTSWYYVFQGMNNRSALQMINMDFMNIVKKRVVGNNDKHYQCIIVYIGFLLRSYFPSISQEIYTELWEKDDNILQNILYSLGKEIQVDSNLSFLKNKFKFSNEIERRNETKKFLNSENMGVQKFAIASYIALALDEKDINDILEKKQNSDSIELKKGLALGLYSFLERKWKNIIVDNKGYQKYHIRDSHFGNSPEYFEEQDVINAECFITKTWETSKEKFALYKEFMRKSCNLDPTDASYLLTLALFYKVENNKEQAIKTIEKLLEMFPDHVLGHLQIVSILEDKEKILYHLHKTQKIAQNHPFFLKTIAESYNLLSDYRTAKFLYQKLFLLSTFKNPELYEVLPEIYKKINNNDNVYADLFSQNFLKILKRKRIKNTK